MDKIKKIAKRVGMAIGALLVLFIGGMLLNFYVRLPKVRPPQPLTAPSNPEAVERGRYLVNNVAGCVGCHSPVQHIPGEPPEEGKLGAGRDFGAPEGAKVHIRAKNITPDKATGIGDYTDGEIARATREGIGKDGHVMFPQMPYRTYGETLSDGEMLDIIAYLRTLKPVANDPGPTTAGFPVSMFIRGVPQPVETVAPPAPSPSDKMARGKWLLRVCSCNECHDSVDSHMQKIPGKSLAGGFRFTIPDGYAIAPNITSDKATGIGAYTDEDIARAINEGKGKDGRNLYVMPWSYYKGMTTEDKAALIAALREAPAISNIVPPSAVSGAK